MLKEKKSAYCKLIASIRPLKEEKNRIRVIIGGDTLEYEGKKINSICYYYYSENTS